MSQANSRSVHRAKGTLRYEPLVNGSPVTFDLEAVSMDEMPQVGFMQHSLVSEVTVKFEARPGGRQDPVTIFSGATLNGPIDDLEIPDIPGHLDAWLELTLQDGSSQSRRHIEIGIQEDYNPGSPEPLLLNLASGLTVSGFAGTSTTLGGSYSTNVANATLTSSPVVVCGTTAQPHKDRWKVRCRCYSIIPGARVRLAWKVGDGPIARERWIDLADLNWYDLDLGTIGIEELEVGHSWTGYIEAYASELPTSLFIDKLELVPA